MKTQIDTTAKKIKIEGDVKLSVLFDHLQKFFPGGEWEDYDLQTNTVINNWDSPIIINKPYPYPWYYENPAYVTTHGTYPTGVVTTGNIIGSGTLTTQGTTTGTCVIDDKFNGTITNCTATDITHPNNQFTTLTATSSAGAMVGDMSTAATPEVSTSGYAKTVGIYNIELN